MNTSSKSAWISNDPKRFTSALKYLGMGYTDYLSARILLRSEQYVQGVILAAAAIEKYFKGLLAATGKPTSGALSKKMIRAVVDSGFDYALINDTFIKWLLHVYTLRYYDNVPKDFKAVISRNNTLAELDKTVNTIELALSFEKDNKPIKSTYWQHLDKKRRHPFLSSGHV